MIGVLFYSIYLLIGFLIFNLITYEQPEYECPFEKMEDQQLNWEIKVIGFLVYCLIPIMYELIK